MFNRAFVDSHVEYQKVYREGTEDRDGYALHYRNEILDSYPRWDEESGDFNVYRCVLVRGDGWQKDTLPAQPLVTNLLWPGTGRPSYERCVSQDPNGETP
jgi:hypothetical protein